MDVDLSASDFLTKSVNRWSLILSQLNQSITVDNSLGVYLVICFGFSQPSDENNNKEKLLFKELVTPENV